MWFLTKPSLYVFRPRKKNPHLNIYFIHFCVHFLLDK